MPYDALIAHITTAFGGVRPPGPGQRDLFDAEAEDTYDTAPPHAPHPARWQDLPEEVLEATPHALSYLDPEGFCYALPAVLCADLRVARDDREARQGAAPKFSGSERSYPGGPDAEDVRSDTGNAGGKPQTSRQGGEPPAIVYDVAWHLTVLDPDSRDHTVWQLSGLSYAQRRAVAAWVAARGRDPELTAAWARLAAAEADGPRDDWAACLFPPRPLPDRGAVEAALWAAFAEDHPWRADLAETLDDPDRPSRSALARRLHPDLRPREKAAQQAELAMLDWPQRRALAGLVERCLQTAARLKWARLTEAEAAGPRADWLEILFTPPPA